jgi:hypothetical protein
LTQLSPFQLKDELIRYAKDQSKSKAATHAFLNAGRGNPNWIAATPREAFFLLGQFALSEARTTRDEGSLAGMPPAAGVAERLRTFLGAAPASAAVDLLQRSLDYASSELGLDADSFAHELVDGIIGDNYPEPDRMLVHAEQVVHRYLVKTMCGERPPAGKFDLSRSKAARRRCATQPHGGDGPERLHVSAGDQFRPGGVSGRDHRSDLAAPDRISGDQPAAGARRLVGGAARAQADPALLMGAVAGARQNTTSMRAAQKESRSAVPGIGYPVPLAIATIALSIVGYFFALFV